MKSTHSLCNLRSSKAEGIKLQHADMHACTVQWLSLYNVFLKDLDNKTPLPLPQELQSKASKMPDKTEEPVADIALIGLAVMGQNLILNMNDHGFVVCAYNRTTEKVDRFLENEAKGTKIVGAHSLEEMVAKLKSPRRVMMLVKAGAAVDAFIDKLVPLLDAGDIIIDGGNSEYQGSQTGRQARRH